MDGARCQSHTVVEAMFVGATAELVGSRLCALCALQRCLRSQRWPRRRAQRTRRVGLAVVRVGVAKAVDKAVEKVASTAYEAPAPAEMRAAVTAVEGSEVAAKAVGMEGEERAEEKGEAVKAAAKVEAAREV